MPILTQKSVWASLLFAWCVQASAGFDTEVSVGQPVWAKDGSGLVVVGWHHVNPDMPQVLGSVLKFIRDVTVICL